MIFVLRVFEMAAFLDLLVALDLRSFVRLHYLLCFLVCLMKL
jgi:hypothetical protein